MRRIETDLGTVPSRELPPRLRLERFHAMLRAKRRKRTDQLALIYHGSNNELWASQNLLEELVPSELPVLELDGWHNGAEGDGQDLAEAASFEETEQCCDFRGRLRE